MPLNSTHCIFKGVWPSKDILAFICFSLHLRLHNCCRMQQYLSMQRRWRVERSWTLQRQWRLLRHQSVCWGTGSANPYFWTWIKLFQGVILASSFWHCLVLCDLHFNLCPPSHYTPLMQSTDKSLSSWQQTQPEHEERNWSWSTGNQYKQQYNIWVQCLYYKHTVWGEAEQICV